MRGKSISQRLPEQFTMGWSGDRGLRVETTIETTHEMDAVIEALLCVRSTLPSTREMVAGDLGIEVREKTYMEAVVEIIG